MKTMNVYEAKTNFSRLLAQVEAGETILIARAGKPVATLTSAPFSISSEEAAARIGFMKSPTSVPDDFDTMGSDVIQALFEGAGDE